MRVSIRVVVGFKKTTPLLVFDPIQEEGRYYHCTLHDKIHALIYLNFTEI